MNNEEKETSIAGDGSSPLPCSRTDSDRLDFLEKHFEQLWRRGQPDMGGCDILLKVRIPGRSPSQHRAHSPTVRMAIDECMDLLPANAAVEARREGVSDSPTD